MKLLMTSRGEAVFLLAAIVVFTIAAISALFYPVEAITFPFVVGLLGFILAVAQLARVFKRDSDSKPASETAPLFKAGKFFIVFLWLIMLVAMIETIGLMTTMPVYTFLFLKFQSKVGWLASFLLSLGLLVVVYFGLVIGFGVNLQG